MSLKNLKKINPLMRACTVYKQANIDRVFTNFKGTMGTRAVVYSLYN